MNSEPNNWLYAAMVFAPVMALGAWLVYRFFDVIWGEVVGPDMTASMRKSCSEGLSLGVYGLISALVLQQFFGRNIMASYLSVVMMVMGMLAGGLAGRRWAWIWRTAGFAAVLFAAIYASLIG